MDWRLYGEEALARREATVWQHPGSLTLEYDGQTLSAYEVELSRETGKPGAVGGAKIFETTFVLPQQRLFALDVTVWLKALRLEGYAPRRDRRPAFLQDALFPYLDAL